MIEKEKSKLKIGEIMHLLVRFIPSKNKTGFRVFELNEKNMTLIFLLPFVDPKEIQYLKSFGNVQKRMA